MRLADPGTPRAALAALLLSACAGSGETPAPPPDPCAWPVDGSTASASVTLLRCDFAIPQLDRERRVWLYLPPDYDRSAERYPVLYMHDGQNVFDAATSYAGEWGVDEALDSLHALGDPGVIVVAVDNGRELRMNEYSPWSAPIRRIRGEGMEYVDFLAETLKPYVDAHYRTRPGPEHTAVAGSSMGGLISLYAMLRHPDVFGLAGVFSPAFWAAPKLYDLAAEPDAIPAGARIYMVTGEREGDDPEAYVRGHQRMAELLEAAAAGGDARVRAVLLPEGTHSEGTWREQFPTAYRWLFDR